MKIINIGLVVAGIVALSANPSLAQSVQTGAGNQQTKIVTYPVNVPGQNDPWAPASGPIED